MAKKTVLKEELIKAIGKVEDEKLLKSVYRFLISHLLQDGYELTEEDKMDLDERMARDKAGLDKSYTWKEVKARVRNRKKIY